VLSDRLNLALSSRCRSPQVTRAGPYEILAPIGAGGMEDVYGFAHHHAQPGVAQVTPRWKPIEPSSAEPFCAHRGASSVPLQQTFGITRVRASSSHAPGVRTDGFRLPRSKSAR